ncbi:MAG: serine/threonine protein kinase [Myxococcales bacterium]|nr:serine/threonine protein kinase [Myxococcales bacterium]
MNGVGGLEPGRIFARRYEVLRPLGLGGMGVVLEVLDHRTSRRRALKVMHGEVAASPAFRARFEREARIAAAVKSDHLVEVLDAGIDAETDMPFLVMELLDGRDLGRTVEADGPLDAAEVATLLVQTGRALDRLHAAGVVHRDLKPENLFVTQRDDGSPCVKILDFGVAKVDTADIAGADTRVGTPLYMAPEQLTGATRVGARADVYALGQVAFKLLVGRAYHEVELAAEGALLPTLARLALGPRRAASECAGASRHRLPAGFDPWFARACHADPDARFASAGEAAASFARLGALSAPPSDSFGDGRREVALAPTLLDALAKTERGPAPPVDPARAPVDELRRPPASRRSWLLVALVAGAAAAAAAVATVAILRGQDHGPPSASSAPATAGAAVTALDAPGSVLACPVLRASGVTEPAGWLGAAASAIACRRAQWLLGGGHERVLPPAALLDFPRAPGAGFPADPFGAADARERALAAARARAAVHLDGFVAAEASAFRLHLEVVTRDGQVVGSADAEGAALIDAVERATEALADAGAIPVSARTSPDVERATLVTSPELGWALDRAVVTKDWATSCAAILARSDLPPLLRHAKAASCSLLVGTAAPDSFALDRSSPAALATAVVAYGVLGRPVPDGPQARAELQAAFERETSPDGRLVLACAIQALDLADVGDTPYKAYGGAVALEHPWEAAWNCDFLTDLMEAMPSPTEYDASGRFVAAWAPHDTSSLRRVGRTDEGVEDNLRWPRRDFELHPDDAEAALELGQRLLRFDRSSDARRLAAGLSTRGARPQLVASYLRMASDAVDGLPARGLEEAKRVMARQEVADSWGFDIYFVHRMQQIALVIGRERAVADLWVDRFATEPGRIQPFGRSGNLVGYLELCARASRPKMKRCLEIVDGAFAAGSRPFRYPVETAYLAGARRLADGDLPGAIAAWRPVAADASYARFLPVELLAQAGEDALAEKIDRERILRRIDARVVRGHGIEHLREAKRADQRGDRARARELARELLDAWATLDADVPALAELRRLAGP